MSIEFESYVARFIEAGSTHTKLQILSLLTRDPPHRSPKSGTPRKVSTSSSPDVRPNYIARGFRSVSKKQMNENALKGLLARRMVMYKPTEPVGTSVAAVGKRQDGDADYKAGQNRGRANGE